SPDRIPFIKKEDPELFSFFSIFQETLAEHQEAYLFLKDIKDVERYKREVELLKSIRDSLSDLNEKVDFLRSKLLSNELGLDKEWSRQLEIYKESIHQYKPKTALHLITQLDHSFLLNDIKPSQAIKAATEFLKGQCHELIGNSEDMHSAYIKAYNLESTTLVYKEKASYAYVHKDAFEKANELADSIIVDDEYNPIAWAVKVISSELDLISILERVPEPVLENLNFKRIVFLYTRFRYAPSVIDEVFKRFSIIPEIDDNEPISFNNYKIKLFFIEVLFNELYQTFYFDFNKPFVGDINIVKSLKPLMEELIEHFKDSEIFDNFNVIRFYNEYFNFILNSDNSAVDRMRFIYEEAKLSDDIFPIILANCLQQIGRVDDAINIIDSFKEKSDKLLYLQGFCFLKNENIEEYISSSIAFLKKLRTVDLYSFENVINIADTLRTFGKLDEINWAEFIEVSYFEHSFLKTLLEEMLSIFLNNYDNNTKNALNEIEPILLQMESPLIFYIAYGYYLIKEFEAAIALFNCYLDKSLESKDLYLYIKSLDKLQIYNEELLIHLKNWRKKFSFHDELLRIEADLSRELFDWDNCIEICEYYDSKVGNDEAFNTLYLESIVKSTKLNKESIIKDLASKFSNFPFTSYSNANLVSSILLEQGFYKYALDVLYEQAHSKENKNARMNYFMAFLQLPSGIVNEYDVVEKGSFVKYEFNGDIHITEIKDTNSFDISLIGHKIGEVVAVKRPMTNILDDVRILRIMDKYLALHDEIIEEVKNPYSGLPMQSIEFTDTSPQGLADTFVSLFGAEGSVKKKHQEDSLLKYYNYDITFTELILSNYQSDYLGGYFNLIYEKDGIVTSPLVFQPSIDVLKEKNLVLDITSLLMIYRISEEHSLKFEKKFFLSRTVLEYLKSYKDKEIGSKKDSLSIDISLEGVNRYKKSADVHRSNIQYLVKLIEWVERNCQIEMAASRLDITRKLEADANNEFFINYIIDNVSLTSKMGNNILVTDDLIHFKFFPIDSGKIITTENF
ncbi:MAG: PIN domain-containing protein, partial [archaeon]